MSVSVGRLAQLACVMEATARKPGNVHPQSDFPAYANFFRSAEAIRQVLDDAAGRPIGEIVLQCIQATRRVVSTNTNLGIVLLLTPLASALTPLPLSEGPSPLPPLPLREGLGEGKSRSLSNELTPSCEAAPTLPQPLPKREGSQESTAIEHVLRDLTVADAVNVYEAIRLAEPGGLGRVKDQDVSRPPTVTLREAMALAADRDMIALQYVNGFAEVFAAADWLGERWRLMPTHPEVTAGSVFEWPSLETRIINLHLHLMAKYPDSLVRRKRGEAEASQLQSLVRAVLDAEPRDRPAHMTRLEQWFADARPHRNPGTTADLIAAALFVALRTGKIPVPTLPYDADTP